VHLDTIKVLLPTDAQNNFFKNRASYIWDGRTANFQMLHFIYFYQQI